MFRSSSSVRPKRPRGWLVAAGLGATVASAPAFAGTLRIPDPGSVSIGSSVTAMTSVADGRYVAFVVGGSDALYVVDTVSKEETSAAACGSSSITAVAGDSTERVYVGCANGVLYAWDMDANGLTSVGDGLDLDSGEITALVVHNGDLYVFAQGDAGRATWMTVNIDNDPISGGTTATSIQSTGEIRRVVSGSTGIGISTLTGVERIAPTGSVVIGSAGGYDDIIDVGVNFVVTGDDGNLWQYNASAASGLAIVNPSGISENASALGWVDGRLVVGTTDQKLRYYSTSGNSFGSSYATLSPPSDGAFGDPVDIVDGEGVDLAATSEGFVWFITDGPWVTVENPSTAISGSTGTEFELSFESDTNGTARVRLNGTGPSNGTDLSGAISVTANETVTLSYTMDSDYVEGGNELRVVVTDSDGDVGQDILTVTKDDPPAQVTFVSISDNNPADPRVARGNEALRVVFRTLDEPDIAKYVVFFDNEEFSAEDYVDCTDQEYCGPEFKRSGSQNSPMVITEWSGSTHEVELDSLRNGKQYWIAVRAYDEGGKEGAMSAILTGTPEAGLGPAELAGEKGGIQCGTTLGAGALGMFAGLLGVAGRRRRWSAPLLGLGLATTMMVGGSANAKDPDAADTRKGHFQFRYGLFTVEDPNITRVMGSTGHDLLWMEAGPHLIPQVELSAGLGWYQEIGNPVLRSGGRSDDNVMLTSLPVNLSLNLRGDFLKHQLIVPAVGMSVEAWNWRQEPTSTSERISGTKTGWSWNAGVQILLDRLDKKSASKLRVRTGIDDTYLTITYRDQTIGESKTGLIYSGQVLGFGLKLDY